MRTICFFLIIFALSSCSILQDQTWKLQRTASGNTTVEAPVTAVSPELNPSEEVEVALASTSAALQSERIPTQTIPSQEAVPANIKRQHSSAELVAKTPLVPKRKDLSELEKIHRSFKRQATWFFVFSVIAGFLGGVILNVDELLPAIPFFILALIGLTAFSIAFILMVKAKRLKNTAPNEISAADLDYIRRMKKIGFIGLMSGIGVGLVSLVLLFLWF